MTDLGEWLQGIQVGAVFGLIAGRFGYWLGRMHEYDYCKVQGWFNPTIKATNAHIHIDATDEQVADALIRESSRRRTTGERGQ
jgi:hypothetical protein